MTTAWLMLAAGDDREHGGNDGYDDNPRYHYSWDETVPSSEAVAVGDVIALWNKKELIGVSVIHAIEIGTAEKASHGCPKCMRKSIKRRRDKKPVFRCYRPECLAEFDDPYSYVDTVMTYRSQHGKTWIDGQGLLSGAELRALCDSPRSQHSMRRMRWEKLRDALLNAVGDELPLELDGGESTPIRGGHKVSKVRVRVGQSAFRERLLREHGEQCAMSGKAPATVLEAAHLYSYAASGEHHEFGGLLLRRDIHRLFDLGHIAVDPVSRLIHVAPELHSYPLYAELHGQPVTVQLRPEHLVWLEAHWLSKRPAA